MIILRRLGGHIYKTATYQKKLMYVPKDFLSGVFAVPELFEATEILQMFSYLVKMVRRKILCRGYSMWKRILLYFSKVDVYFQRQFYS